MSQALYAGTFDPLTNGHIDIVERGLKVFEKILIVVAVPPKKTPYLQPDKRVEVISSIFENEPRVDVKSWSGLIVDCAKKYNINSIIRGLRPVGDFDSEFQMAAMNRNLYHEADTVFFMTCEKYFYLSSSLVREVFSHGGDISTYVHPKVLKLMQQEFRS
jgi:pantetheine-phosphate adenylyltransferase